MTIYEIYMNRCIELASLGAGAVAPNPMVGAVLVFKDRIIGEGFHQEYGQAHAEVNCINSVRAEDKNLITDSTLYVSLEPCVHYGKTPPCTNLIIQHNIKQVIIGSIDPFNQVSGKGIAALQAAGISVITGILYKECQLLNKRFFTFHDEKRPFIILKWAQTANNKIAGSAKERLQISNKYTNRLVHKWRSEEASILIGTNTAMLDDPALTTRLWTGHNPIRLVIDRHLQLPPKLQIFYGKAGTIIFNEQKHTVDSNESAELISPVYFRIHDQGDMLPSIADACYRLNIQSIMVEGGTKTLQHFIDTGLWDEARVITNTELEIENGLEAPVLHQNALINRGQTGNDRIDYYQRIK